MSLSDSHLIHRKALTGSNLKTKMRREAHFGKLRRKLREAIGKRAIIL